MAQEKAAAAAAAVANLGITPDKLQGMFADQAKGKPVSMIAKLMFVAGMALFSVFTFVDKRHTTLARAAEAEARALKAHHWELPLRPVKPEGPPDPERSPFKDKWQETKTLDGGATVVTSKVPDDVKEEYKATKKAYEEQTVKKFDLESSKEYADAMWDFANSRWEKVHLQKAEEERLERTAEIERYKATVGGMGYLGRWLGMSLMFLGMGLLTLLGDKQEQLVGLLVLGLGLMWPMVNMGIM